LEVDRASSADRLVGQYQCRDLMQAITGSQWRSRKKGVTWENFGKLNTRRAAAFWVRCKGLIVEAGSPARRELQSSRQVMMSARSVLLI